MSHFVSQLFNQLICYFVRFFFWQRRAESYGVYLDYIYFLHWPPTWSCCRLGNMETPLMEEDFSVVLLCVDHNYMECLQLSDQTFDQHQIVQQMLFVTDLQNTID